MRTVSCFYNSYPTCQIRIAPISLSHKTLSVQREHGLFLTQVPDSLLNFVQIVVVKKSAKYQDCILIN